MSYTKDRDEFLALMNSEGLRYEIAVKLLRYATTLQRLAVAQCNGDWPADNGDRKVEFCPECESGFVPASFKRVAYMTEGNGGRTYYKRICPDCRTGELVKKALPEGYTPMLGGDPRGCVLKIQVPSGKTNDWGREGICVPSRYR